MSKVGVNSGIASECRAAIDILRSSVIVTPRLLKRISS